MKVVVVGDVISNTADAYHMFMEDMGLTISDQPYITRRVNTSSTRTN